MAAIPEHMGSDERMSGSWYLSKSHGSLPPKIFEAIATDTRLKTTGVYNAADAAKRISKPQSRFKDSHEHRTRPQTDLCPRGPLGELHCGRAKTSAGVLLERCSRYRIRGN